MPKDIHPELKSIGEYLELKGAKSFRIPEYQREYRWGIDQCDALWQDIWNFMVSNDDSDKEKYFFGTIIINCQDNDAILELIDGQQRTTTFLLLFKALLIRINHLIDSSIEDEDSEDMIENLKDRRKRLMSILYHRKTDGISPRPHREKDRLIWENSSILDNYSINEDKENKEELQNILQSWDFEEAQRSVRQIKYRRNDNRYTNYFRNFKFFYEKLQELNESMTNALANTILDQCNLIEIKSWNVEQAIAMFNSLNSAGLPLSDANIISAKLFANADRRGVILEYTSAWAKLKELTKDSIVDINSILLQYMYYVRSKNREIGEEGTNVTTPGLRRYYTSINESLLDDPIRLCTDLTNLAIIWKTVLSYPVIQVLLRFNVNAKLFLAGFFYRFNSADIKETDEKDIVSVAECFLRLFSLLELVDLGYSSRYFKGFLFRESLKLVDAGTSIETIIADFDQHISNNDVFKIEDIRKRALEYGSSALVCLNEFLIARESGDLDEFNLDANPEIEHIMSKSIRNRSAVMHDVGIDDPEEFNRFVDRLGNKILLESSINKSISDSLFRSKIDFGYKKSRYPRAKQLASTYENVNNRFWGKKEIEEATEIAVERILQFIYNNK